jgi:hemoglobin/transferrin/lactoferrin receptor protein
MKSRDRRRLPHRQLRHLLFWSLLLAPYAASAQSTSPAPSADSQPPAPAEDAPSPGGAAAQPRFLDTVTVSATLNPVPVKDTPGTVSVIGADTIARRLIENVADLVAFEPGVYVETTANRVGLNGVNIRGIGGNRVMMQVDGVETSEQFDFGPFNVHQFALDLDTLDTAEIVRSAGSSLYGSDALGGVVSFFTKDPADYLPGSRLFHLGAKTTFDSRAGDVSGNVVIAGGRPRVQASVFASYAGGHEPRNKGGVETETVTRTALNPQARRSAQALGKLVVSPGAGNVLRGVVEAADNDIETQAFSLRAVTVAGPTTSNVADITSEDAMRRRRISVDHALTNRAGLNQWSWNLYAQQTDTGQIVDEVRVMTGAGPVLTVLRSGTLDYAQDSYGGGVQGRKAFASGGQAVLLTFGGGHKRNRFDMLRDRVDVNAASGAVIPTTNLILPSKYFPRSDVGETGAYVQAEMKLGRMTLVPGIRHDRFSLDADETDAVYIASLSPAAADFEADATSARVGAAVNVSNAVTLHAQYAGGFRAPPYSAVNSGFTNLLGGYTSIPNTDLDAETSDNMEVGVRSAAGPINVGVTGFWNAYDDFILQVQRGVNPATRLLEFQYQNVSKVNIRGVELQGEAQLARGLRLRASYAVIRGDDVSGDVDVPLNTIAPDQGVVGLQYTAASSRWGGDVMLRAAHGQSAETAGAGFYVPDAYGVVDLFGWAEMARGVTLRAGVRNLTDRKYFEWPNVRGRQAADPTIDRYSSPGVSALLSLAYGW